MKVSFLLVLALATRLGNVASDGTEAFTQLKTLEGTWHGTYRWSGARSDAGDLTTVYHLTGMGSALVEDLIMDGKPAMSSVYHLDNGDLRVTHYCGAQNQPRLKAKAIDLSNNTFDFEYVDATNLKTPDAPHVNGLKVHIIDPNHLDIEFGFTAKGQESIEHIALAR